MRISKNAQLNFLQNTVFDMTLTNLVMAMVVLHEEFGFGKQRLDQFIKAVEAKVKIFDEMARDAVLDEKTKGIQKEHAAQFREIIKQVSAIYLSQELYSELFEAPLPTYAQTSCKRKNDQREYDKRTAVSKEEAARLQEFMSAVRDYSTERSIGNEHNRAIEAHKQGLL